MAELVGVVASGITIGTLAAQIASSITKLRSYRNQVQNAPEDIQDMIHELEALNHLLASVEHDLSRSNVSSLAFSSQSVSQCLEQCKQASVRLEELTDSLSKDLRAESMSKRRWASAKIVLKKDRIERHKGKLERSIRILSFSYQVYNR